ncbi:transposase [Streptomyces sp. NBC_00882]|uniref:transposase n=1 Tax=Streptomyces TaxID=1883 RepID=UPI00386DF0C8|nr:transposase [Streptomyces sp. NBC_00882]WSZ60877.1 transposase [Streptomyces canus]
MESGCWTIDDPAAFGGRDAPQLSARVPPQGPRSRGVRKRVAEVAQLLGISDQTIYVWHRQHLIDAGQLPGMTSSDQSELVADRKRIAELEAELAVHRRAAELPGEVTSPKGGSKPSV